MVRRRKDEDEDVSTHGQSIKANISLAHFNSKISELPDFFINKLLWSTQQTRHIDNLYV